MKSIGRFTELIEELRAEFENGSVAELLRALLERSGYLDALRAERTIEAEGRIENLEELVGVAAEFDANRRSRAPRIAPLEEFLQAISLYTDQDDISKDESPVTLMTLHNAKGLEYDAVFISAARRACSRTRARSRRATRRRSAGSPMSGSRAPASASGSPTRAAGGCSPGARPDLPSRFLSELPDDLVEREGDPGAGDSPAGRSADRRARPPRPIRRSRLRLATTSCTRASATVW